MFAHATIILFCNTIHASVGFFKLQLSLLYVYIHYIVQYKIYSGAKEISGPKSD